MHDPARKIKEGRQNNTRSSAKIFRNLVLDKLLNDLQSTPWAFIKFFAV